MTTTKSSKNLTCARFSSKNGRLNQKSRTGKKNVSSFQGSPVASRTAITKYMI